MDLFFGRIMRHLIFEELYDFERNPWANASEKSSAAMSRQSTAESKFDYLANQMNLALVENAKVTLAFGCHEKSSSPLKLLSQDLLDNILEYVGGMKGPENGEVARHRTSLSIIPFEGWRRWRGDVEPEDTGGIDLANMNLYQPGQKIVIPLAKPNLHLTGPCYRDLRKHVLQNEHWSLKRIAATPQQKQEYGERRKGTVYFVQAVYTVPGQEGKKRKYKKRERKSDPVPEPLSPAKQALATAALADAIQSAEVNGVVDEECLQCAIDLGYSKRFVLGKAAEQWDNLKDTKPPAKKRAKKNR